MVPRQRVALGLYARSHQSMVSRVKLHLIETVPESVVGFELGRIAVGLKAQLDEIGLAGQPTELDEGLLGPGRALPLHRLDQHRILQIRVVVGQLGGLIEDLVGIVGHDSF